MLILALSVLLLCHQQLIPEVGVEMEPVVPSSNTEFYSMIVEQHREIVEVCSDTALGFCGPFRYNCWFLWWVQIQLLVTVACSNTMVGFCGVFKYNSWFLWWVQIQLLVSVVGSNTTVGFCVEISAKVSHPEVTPCGWQEQPAVFLHNSVLCTQIA